MEALVAVIIKQMRPAQLSLHVRVVNLLNSIFPSFPKLPISKPIDFYFRVLMRCVQDCREGVTKFNAFRYHMSVYLFFRISNIVNPKPVTPHRITVATMMIYSEPKLYTTSTLLKIKEMERRIIPPIMSFRL